MITGTATVEELLDLALLALERGTGLHMTVDQREVRNADFTVDAILRLHPGGQELLAKVKKWAQHKNFGALVNELRALPGEGLLVTDFVNPAMAARLREHQVQFIDAQGNAFINQPPVYVYVTTNRARKHEHLRPAKEGGLRRAFEPKGLMVVYAFLLDPALVGAPYREIAERAGVALGTVGKVIDALKAGGLVREITGGGRRLVHYHKLLNCWVDAWPEKLKPKQFVGEFITDDPNWWEHIDIRKYDGYWGGEVAAAKFTAYLKPQIVTIYLPAQTLPQLLRDGRLHKATRWTGDKAAVVQIYKPFWPKQEGQYGAEAGLVHPILAYADLLETGDPRNLEAAQQIYEKHIAQYCRED